MQKATLIAKITVRGGKCMQPNVLEHLFIGWKFSAAGQKTSAPVWAANLPASCQKPQQNDIKSHIFDHYTVKSFSVSCSADVFYSESDRWLIYAELWCFVCLRLWHQTAVFNGLQQCFFPVTHLWWRRKRWWQWCRQWHPWHPCSSSGNTPCLWPALLSESVFCSIVSQVVPDTRWPKPPSGLRSCCRTAGPDGW